MIGIWYEDSQPGVVCWVVFREDFAIGFWDSFRSEPYVINTRNGVARLVADLQSSEAIADGWKRLDSHDRT